jgi:hypothetical protein
MGIALHLRSAMTQRFRNLRRVLWLIAMLAIAGGIARAIAPPSDRRGLLPR